MLFEPKVPLKDLWTLLSLTKGSVFSQDLTPRTEKISSGIGSVLQSSLVDAVTKQIHG